MRGAVAVERRGRHVATMLATAAFGEQAPYCACASHGYNYYYGYDSLWLYTLCRHSWAVQSRRRLSWRCASVRSRYCSGTTH